MISAHRREGAGGNRAGNGAAQVVLGIAVTSGKIWAGESENILHLRGRCSLQQQTPGNPEIHNTPVRLRKALVDVPLLHAIAVDLLGLSPSDAGGRRLREHREGNRRRGGMLVCLVRRSYGCKGKDRLQQCISLRRQPGLGVHDLHEGSRTARCKTLRLLVGEAGEPSQMTPVGAGQIATVGVRQMLADGNGHRRFQGGDADTNPGLKMTGGWFQAPRTDDVPECAFSRQLSNPRDPGRRECNRRFDSRRRAEYRHRILPDFERAEIESWSCSTTALRSKVVHREKDAESGGESNGSDTRRWALLPTGGEWPAG